MWSIAVITAPRDPITLDATLDSVDDLKGDKCRIFVAAEPGSPSPIGTLTLINGKKRGPWWNWIKAARHVCKTLQTTYVLMLEDDVLIHPDSLLLAETFFRHRLGPNAISLYTCKFYSSWCNRRNGVHPIPKDRLFMGSLALAFRRTDLEALVHHPEVEKWNGCYVKKALPHTISAIDAGIGKVAESLGMRIWHTHPSAVFHAGETSSIPGHGSNEVSRNRQASHLADFSRPLQEQVPIAGSLFQ